MPTWIKAQKEQQAEHYYLNSHAINIDTLNAFQRKCYGIIQSHYEDNSDEEPLLLIILGVAGTGEKY